MKTTFEITESLMAEARLCAAREGLTFSELVESSLRHEIERRASAQGEGFHLQDASVDGRGLRPDIAQRGWDGMRTMAYAEHGA